MAVQSKLLERPLADFNGKDWPKFRFNMEVRCEGIGTTFLEAFTDTVNRKKTACVVWGALVTDSRACVDESFYKVKSRDAVKSGMVALKEFDVDKKPENTKLMAACGAHCAERITALEPTTHPIVRVRPDARPAPEDGQPLRADGQPRLA